MLDQMLGWAVIWLPIALSVAFIFVPARSEDKEQHVKWRYWLVVVAVLLGALSWWQQSRAIKQAGTDRQNAIEQTSTQVATSVAASVSASNQVVVTNLTGQIGDLKGQLAKQSGVETSIKDAIAQQLQDSKKTLATQSLKVKALDFVRRVDEFIDVVRVSDSFIKPDAANYDAEMKKSRNAEQQAWNEQYKKEAMDVAGRLGLDPNQTYCGLSVDDLSFISARAHCAVRIENAAMELK